MNSQATPEEPGQILTFYSYKGGTGRSMVLANTACLLAQQPEGNGGILTVDWDLEAPGLHRYFADRFRRQFEGADGAEAALEGSPGLIDLFIALAAEIDKLPPIAEEPTPEIQEQLAQAVNLDSYILRTDVPNVCLLKAGTFDETYARRVNTFQWEALYNRAPWVIALVADWFTSRFRYTLIDSRTGITDTSGICTMLLPDKLVAVFTPNQQSLDGVLQMAERSTNYRRRSADLRPLSVFPLPSRIETSEPDLREHWRKGTGTGYQPRFEALFRKVWELDECNLDAYFNEVQIQHSSAYAYGEKVAVLLEKTNDRTSLRRAYASFVERLGLDVPWDVPETSSAEYTRVAEVAESIYAYLKPNEQDAAKRLFLQLIRVPPDSLKPAAIERELKSLIVDPPTLQAFVGPKVIAFRKTDTETYFRVADETLVSTWRRLSEWIAADLEFLRWRDSLDAAKANWEKFGHAKEGLLRGLPLQEAENRLTGRRADLNTAEEEYIQASKKAGRRRKALQWSIGVAAALVALVGLALVIGYKDQARKAQAQAVLDQGGIDAAIRAVRIYSYAPIDASLRTLLTQLPQPVAAIPTSAGTALGMVSNKDASLLAVSYPERVVCYSLKGGAPLTMPLPDVQSMDLSPDGKWLAVGYMESSGFGTRKLRNLQTGAETVISFGGPVTAIAFNADASKIATGGGGAIYLSEVGGAKTIRIAQKDVVNGLAFSPNGQTLASAGALGTVQLWTTDTGRSLAILQPVRAAVKVPYSANGDYGPNQTPVTPRNEVAFSPDGRLLATMVSTGIELVNVEDRKARSFVFPEQVSSFAFGQSDRILVACLNGVVYSASLADSATPQWMPDGAPGALGVSAFSKDGALFALAMKSGIAVYKPQAAPQDYKTLGGSELADAACKELKILAPIDPDYSKACPGK